MNSLVALSRNDPLDWTSKDFDKILNDGRRVYLDHLDKKGLKPNTMLFYDALLGDEVVQVGNRQVRIAVQHHQTGGELGRIAENVNRYDELYAPLEINLTKLFRDNDKAIILIEAEWMAVRKARTLLGK